MSRKKLMRQVERRSERRHKAHEKERQEQTARGRWLGSDASYQVFKAIREDASVADNEKLAVFQAEMYRQKPKSGRSFMDSIYVWMVDRRKTAAFRTFVSLCGIVHKAPDNKPFMTALMAASYFMAALCVVTAVITEHYSKYLCSAVVILALSYVCREYIGSTRARHETNYPAGNPHQ
jgi:hypothetical protein